MAGPKFSKAQREEVLGMFNASLSLNFGEFLTPTQITGLALVMTTQVCRRIAKYPQFIKDRTYSVQDIKRAWGEFLVERLHVGDDTADETDN